MLRRIRSNIAAMRATAFCIAALLVAAPFAFADDSGETNPKAAKNLQFAVIFCALIAQALAMTD